MTYQPVYRSSKELIDNNLIKPGSHNSGLHSLRCYHLSLQYLNFFHHFLLTPSILCKILYLNLFENMPHSFLFGLHIKTVKLLWLDFNRHPLPDRQAKALQTIYLIRIVG